VDLGSYLQRIGVEWPSAPDAEALTRLHQAHLLAVPFENLSIGWGEPIELDLALLFRKVVEERRGGGCFELNALFAWALGALGFEVDLLSARVRREAGGFGPDFDHMCLRVRTSGEDWLADVGFGDSFRRPLPLAPGTARTEGRRTYALRVAGAEMELSRREAGGPWEPQYRFGPAARRLAEFSGMAEFHQHSPEGPFTRRRVCTRATADGRVTLTEAALVWTTLAGDRVEKAIGNQAEWELALRTHFGIRRRPSAGPPEAP
jgi:N-hydroxyarylamine O-acetyltransferase